MKTIAYFDCPTGIAGDMCLAALVDAGVPLDYLQQQLAKLGISHEFTLSINPTHRRGLRALYAQVSLITPPASEADKPSLQLHQTPHAHSHPATQNDHSPLQSSGNHAAIRNLPNIEQIITQADLPERVKQWSLAIFRRLAEAEAAVHGIALEHVHFHEVGATDAIVDIVGTCLGLDYLEVDAVVCSSLPTGRGQVRAAHGHLPVPAPAVLKLLELAQVPIYSNGLDGELVTPTGAAIATALANYFGDPPTMTLQCIGLGAGGKDLPVANILRLWVGKTAPISDDNSLSKLPSAKPLSYDTDTITLLETQVDDMVPQAVGYLHERLYAAGALEVFAQPIVMKKSRPGLMLTVICQPTDELRCTDILFTETPTLGIRRQNQQRWILPRQIHTIQTAYGPVAVKVAYHPHTHAVLNIHPEYEDCAATALHHQVPWQVVYQTTLHTWYNQQPST
ncbi:nickel pincer cofactor biosynthesis protein LarC [Nodosilinea sp. LEGE 07088]|uniref:nickel pincer cofactor biosynthesis protein LarC n=1 Tax=Nodosilinea sp. LEGE 07088 TaxID=2777968 RepID=UPI00187FE7B9|nr:nickel pincer cofactor biosynthesis protein LarC [Nodosilinea sp. LEGE 07088]MBE9139259.1 nickel pincer cofactor biosynthesis protein LarC [Nodosilinea sp. LEGE 07088]